MPITRELLEARREQAINVRDQAFAQYQAQIGAIATIDHLLKVLSAESSTPKKP